MTALTKERSCSFERWREHVMILAAPYKAWKGAEVGLNLDTQKLQPMGTDDDLLYVGTAMKTVDAAAGDKQLSVDFGVEKYLRWFANDTVSPVNKLGAIAYALDDQTATRDTSNAQLGRVWGISSVDGVLIERIATASPLGGGGTLVDLPAYTANNISLADIIHDGVYDVPTTGAASTITLPAAADQGTVAIFTADGTKNGHTVTYRDETGPTAITTALTASKRHLVVVTFLGTTWRANAYVSP